MSIEYEYNSFLNTVFTCLPRDQSISEVGAHFNRVIKDEGLKDGFIDVVDFEHIEDFSLSSNDATDIVRFLGRLKEVKKVRATIFISRSSVAFGTAHVLKERHGLTDPLHDIFVVRSGEEALDKIESIHRS